jgi:hypothetical protein
MIINISNLKLKKQNDKKFQFIIIEICFSLILK